MEAESDNSINGDLSSYQQTSFKSRFLKTERSAALLKEETESKSENKKSQQPPPPGSLRSFRSTFSPLAKLTENVELQGGGGGAASSSSSGGNGNTNNNDKLSKNIQAFIDRTDHVSNEWKNLGSTPTPHRRSGSVERGTFENDHSLSMRPSLSVRACSVAPSYGKIANNPVLSSGYGGSCSTFRDNDFTNRSSIRSVSHSVTNRARDARGDPRGLLFKAPAAAPTLLQQRQGVN